MTNPLDKLNLRPFEKRLVVGVAVVIFIVVNAVFVFPYFGQWGRVQQRMVEAREKLSKWQSVAAEEPRIKKLVDELTKQGQAVEAEEQVFQFRSTIETQARQNGVNIVQSGRVSAQTNQFFVEQTQTIALQSGEQQLVDFLYTLGSGNSLIRVRDLGLRPDPPRQSLSGTVTLIASYQKKTPARAAPASRKTASASTPALATVTSIAK
jgi:type II secretory pathway component PulM